MESPKPVGTLEGQKTLPTKFVDLEKGQEVVDVEAQTTEGVGIRNQAMANLVNGIVSIVMVILIDVYIILAFMAFKNMRVGLASACTIITAPFYIFTLVVLNLQRDNLVESFAKNPKNNANGCNSQSGNM